MPNLPPIGLVALALAALGAWLLVYTYRNGGIRRFEGRVLAGTAAAVLSLALFTGQRAASTHPIAQDRGHWEEVARWQGDAFLVTEPFTVDGLWRIRWRLASAEEPVIIMVTEPNGSTVLETLADQNRYAEGVFQERAPGSYALMFHNSVAFEVIVEQQR
ncbi:MAG: hypothetical protein AAB289_14930 [Chloroflexota bacterium]